MTVLDIGVIVVAAFFIVRGVWIGFVRQLAFLLALFLGYAAAGTYYPSWAQHLSQISNPQLRFVVTYGLLFFTTYVVIMLLGLGLKKVMHISFLGWFDRLMGGVFGMIKAVFLTTLLFMALTGIVTSDSVFIRDAFFTKYLIISSAEMTSIIKDKELRGELLLKKPALSGFLSDPVPVLQSLGRDTK